MAAHAPECLNTGISDNFPKLIVDRAPMTVIELTVTPLQPCRLIEAEDSAADEEEPCSFVIGERLNAAHSDAKQPRNVAVLDHRIQQLLEVRGMGLRSCGSDSLGVLPHLQQQENQSDDNRHAADKAAKRGKV